MPGSVCRSAHLHRGLTVFVHLLDHVRTRGLLQARIRWWALCPGRQVTRDDTQMCRRWDDEDLAERSRMFPNNDHSHGGSSETNVQYAGLFALNERDCDWYVRRIMR